MDTVQISCPYCGSRDQVSIPDNAQEYQHRCNRCKRLIHARQDEHCVICSYGDQKCGQE